MLYYTKMTKFLKEISNIEARFNASLEKVLRDIEKKDPSRPFKEYMHHFSLISAYRNLEDVFRCIHANDKDYGLEKIDSYSENLDNEEDMAVVKETMAYLAGITHLYMDDMKNARNMLITSLSYLKKEVEEEEDKELLEIMEEENDMKINHLSFLVKNAEIVRYIFGEAVEHYAKSYDIDKDLEVFENARIEEAKRITKKARYEDQVLKTIAKQFN